MRVLHIITGLSTGGTETMLHKLLGSMDRKRFEPTVVSLVSGGRLTKEIRALGVPVLELGMARGLPSLSAIYSLLRAVRRMRPDVIQGWMYHGNLAAWFAGWMVARSAALVWNIRQSLYAIGREKPGTRAVIHFCASLSGAAARILYNSEAARLQHEAIGYRSDRSETIPNGFETAMFRPEPAARTRLLDELGAPREAVLIGLVARYHPMKDHVNFLAAATRLAAHCPQACFVLAGSGVDADNATLARQIAANGLQGRVYLLGERTDVAALTAALDIATSSSNSEAFPNALGEAMSCGVPCVATDVGDSAAIVGDTGRIVPPNDAAALAGAWEELIELGEEGRRLLGADARVRVMENYSLDAVAQSYEALYEALALR